MRPLPSQRLPQASGRREIRIRMKINKTEMRVTAEKVDSPKVGSSNMTNNIGNLFPD